MEPRTLGPREGHSGGPSVTVKSWKGLRESFSHRCSFSVASLLLNGFQVLETACEPRDS